MVAACTAAHAAEISDCTADAPACAADRMFAHAADIAEVIWFHVAIVAACTAAQAACTVDCTADPPACAADWIDVHADWTEDVIDAHAEVVAAGTVDHAVCAADRTIDAPVDTAAVIDANGKYLGKYRKNHIPQVAGFWEKFFFKPGNLGYPVFQTKYAKVGVYICYDRHFPDGARILGLNGAEIVYNPSATVAGLSQYLWKLEQPAHAAANGYFMGCINRVGTEKPWNLGKFYGSSYFVDPRGQIFTQASEDNDELLIAEFDLDMIEEVRSVWQFFRDRRPETYGKLTEL